MDTVKMNEKVREIEQFVLSAPVLNASAEFADIDKQIAYVEETINGMEKFTGMNENVLMEKQILRTLHIAKWVTEQCTNDLLKMTGNEPTEPGIVEELVDTLKKAKEIIRAWHGMGYRNEDQERAEWSTYDTRSPEMKIINEVLSKHEDGKEDEHD